MEAYWIYWPFPIMMTPPTCCWPAKPCDVCSIYELYACPYPRWEAAASAMVKGKTIPTQVVPRPEIVTPIKGRRSRGYSSSGFASSWKRHGLQLLDKPVPVKSKATKKHSRCCKQASTCKMASRKHGRSRRQALQNNTRQNRDAPCCRPARRRPRHPHQSPRHQSPRPAPWQL